MNPTHLEPPSPPPLPTLPLSGGRTLRDILDEYERRLLVATLQATAWNQREAARILGLLPSTLSEKMKKLGLRLTRGQSRAWVVGLAARGRRPPVARPFSRRSSSG